MTDPAMVPEGNAPIEPKSTKHVPFWPWLLAFVFLVAAVVAGAIASDKARDDGPGISTTTTSTTVRDFQL